MTTSTNNNSNFLFLRETNQEDSFIYVVYKDRIKDVQLNECFDRHGQYISYEDAGDYSIYNQYSDAKIHCNREIRKNLNLSEEELEGEDKDKISALIEEWEKENADYTMARGFNYWDGSNYRSVILSSDDDSAVSHEELTGCDIPSIDFENMEHLRNGFGTEIYQFEDWYIVKSHTQGSWENYKVIRKSEIEEDQL